MPSLDLITPPTVEPVTLAEVKTWLRVDNTSEDGEIQELIFDARRLCEQIAGKALITQTWKWTFDLYWRRPGILSHGGSDADEVPERYADKMIRSGMWIRHQPHVLYPLAPLQAITAFTYRLGGTDVAYDFSQVRVEQGGQIIFDPYALPPLSDEQFGAVSITATLGYGVDGTTVPPVYLRAIRHLCAHWYDNRGLYVMPNGRGRILPGEAVDMVRDILMHERRMRI